MDKLFNDSVHGHIVLPTLCVKIIDTQIFQRLRHLKQMGLVYWVYPGASHNRFEHCLGVSHLAGLIVENLNRNRRHDSDPEITEKEKLCLQVAGLCHDLGHGPFSHTWEKFVHKVGDRNWKHEDMSVKLFELILENEEVEREFTRQGLGDNHKQMIKDFITSNTPTGETKAFLYEIIANKETGIDVDKWDYLLRDTRHLNIGITFDPHRLMNCQRVMMTERDGKYHICYRDKASAEIRQMYMMRGDIHRKACHHPVVKMLEEMLLDALIYFNDSGYRFFGRRLSEAHENPAEYASLTDEIFQELYRSGRNNFEEGWDLLKNIKERKMYKVWRREKLEEEDYPGREDRFKNICGEINQALRREDIDVYVTSIKPDVNYDRLRRNVFTYNKNNIVSQGDWSPSPMFFSSLQDVEKHQEVIFYSKSNVPIEGFSEAAQRIQINSAIRTVLEELKNRRP